MKKLLPFAALALLLFTACPQSPVEEAQTIPLPYEEQVGTLTQYKNFARGPYALKADTPYSLCLAWEEGGSLALHLADETGSEQTIMAYSGVPNILYVPKDGFYHIQAPLDGTPITGLGYSLQESPE